MPSITPSDPSGTDLRLDMNGDIVLNPQGDIDLHTGVENVKQMIRSRLQTTPSTYIFGKDLGSELGKTIDDPLTPQKKNLIERYVYNALIIDPRVTKINSVSVVDPNDGSMRLLVTVNVAIVGYGNIQTTVSIGG